MDTEYNNWGVNSMDGRILIVTDESRKIPFSKIVTFYKLDIVNLSKFQFMKESQYSLLVVNVLNFKECVSVSNMCRLGSSWIPILIIVDPETQLMTELEYIRSIDGSGQIRLIRWKEKYPYELIDNIQNIINPSYVVKTSSIAIVIPVYNEEKRFKHIYDFIVKLKILLKNGMPNASIFFLNDGSTDGTEKMIDELIEHYSDSVEWVDDMASISYYKLSYNTRKAGTYIEALNNIRASLLIFVDSDNSFEIDDIAKMINIINLGYFDIVVGSKDAAKDRKITRKFVSFFKRIITKSFLPKGITDSQTGLKVISWDCAKYILPYLHRNMQLAIDLEMMYIAKRLNFRVLQLSVKCTDRQGSHVNIVKDSITFIKNLHKIKKLDKDIKLKCK